MLLALQIGICLAKIMAACITAIILIRLVCFASAIRFHLNILHCYLYPTHLSRIDMQSCKLVTMLDSEIVCDLSVSYAVTSSDLE